MKVNEDRAAYDAQREVERLRHRVRDLEMGLDNAIWALENSVSLTPVDRNEKIRKLKAIVARDISNL